MYKLNEKKKALQGKKHCSQRQMTSNKPTENVCNWYLKMMSNFHDEPKVEKNVHLVSKLSYRINITSSLKIFFFIFVFLGPYLRHMEVSRLGVELELQLPAYTTDTAAPVLNSVCNLHHSSWHCWILNTLSKARDWTCILMDTSQVHYHWATAGTPQIFILIFALACPGISGYWSET